MKKVLYSILALATLLTAASCNKEFDGGKPSDGFVSITLSVSLGPQTRAFADGTTADRLYAGIYEIGESGSLVWTADNSAEPAEISGMTATVSFADKIQPGKSYKVVFWAQKSGAPYSLDWAAEATTGPVVTVTSTGSANDESRDAFYGSYDTGVVSGSIDLSNAPVSLKRPFAQVNILVPNDKLVDATAAVTSSMTVAQAPTVLNLATKATSVPSDWTFSTAAIDEPAFGKYANTHKYVAMNYVLTDQTAADAAYDVTFSVTSAAATPQVAENKLIEDVPLVPNGRTNIVGNIFTGSFSVIVPGLISPDFDSDQEVTIVDNGQDPDPQISVPDFTTISELKAILTDTATDYAGTLDGAIVSFIASTSDAVIKDATGSIMYHKESGHGLLQGQTISGDVIVSAQLYNGISEILDLAATIEGVGSVYEPEVVTLSQLAVNYSQYENAYVKVVGVISQTTTTTKGNISVTQDATSYVIYTNVAIPVNAGDVLTAEGTVTKYNDTEEIRVWKASDLTVTNPAPVLSATPASTTVAASATSVSWAITSNTDWTITPGAGVTPSYVSGNGNAEVTLSFAANESSAAVTYTATVSASGCADVTITITQNGAGSSSAIKDEIIAAYLTATSTTYYDFSNVAVTSSARYAGNTAKDSSGNIQMRSKNSNSGIVSTISGGRVKSVKINIASGTNTIDVYGSNTAYTAASDLYATGENSNQGTKIGSVSSTGTIEFTEDYAYVGIRSNNGAVYVSSIEIVWE